MDANVPTEIYLDANATTQVIPHKILLSHFGL